MCKLKENKKKFGISFIPSKLLNDRKYKKIIGRIFSDIFLRYLKVIIANF